MCACRRVRVLCKWPAARELLLLDMCARASTYIMYMYLYMYVFVYVYVYEYVYVYVYVSVCVIICIYVYVCAYVTVLCVCVCVWCMYTAKCFIREAFRRTSQTLDFTNTSQW